MTLTHRISDRSWIPSTVTLLILLLGMAAIGWLQVPQLHRLKQNSQMASVATLRQDSESERLRLRLLQQLPSLGFRNALADWTFLNFLQYFGDGTARAKTDYQLSPEYFATIVTFDPYFIQSYMFLSTGTALYAGAPEQSTALMQRALASLKPNIPPDSYFTWRQLGIDQLLFLGDGAAARSSFETAAAWAKQSGQPGSDHIAAMSEKTAQFLASNPNSKSAQVAAWAMVLGNAPDERTRQLAVQRITLLGGEIIKNPDGTFRISLPNKD